MRRVYENEKKEECRPGGGGGLWLDMWLDMWSVGGRRSLSSSGVVLLDVLGLCFWSSFLVMQVLIFLYATLEVWGTWRVKEAGCGKGDYCCAFLHSKIQSATGE